MMRLRPSLLFQDQWAFLITNLKKKADLKYKAFENAQIPEFGYEKLKFKIRVFHSNLYMSY